MRESYRRWEAGTRARTDVAGCTRCRWTAVAAGRRADQRRAVWWRTGIRAGGWRRTPLSTGRSLPPLPRPAPPTSNSAAVRGATVCRAARSPGTETRCRGAPPWCCRSRAGSDATQRAPPTDDSISAADDHPSGSPPADSLRQPTPPVTCTARQLSRPPTMICISGYSIFHVC